VIPPLLGAGLTAFVVAAAVTPLVIAGAGRLGLVDRPSARSSHRRPTPRGGGVGLMAGALAGIWWAGSWPDSRGPAALLGGALALGVLGLADDRGGLPKRLKLALEAVVVGAVVATTGGPERLPLPPPLDLQLSWLGTPLAAIWVLTVINFYNFLDGIDGIAGLQGVVTALGLAAVCGTALAGVSGAALAGGCLGFLLYNWSPARVFMGDVGSLFLGYTLAALPLLGPPSGRGRVVFFVAISLWLFLADATWTLLRRIARGERFFYEPHREHLYQRLVASGWSHRQVSGLVGTGSAVLTVAGAWALRQSGGAGAWALLGLALVLFAVEVSVVRRGESARPRT
jgi:Fuc2NAc and GlcNAc transferase